MSWLEKLRRDGCLPMKTVAFFTGMALTIIACLTFAAKLLDLNVVGAINQVWLWVGLGWVGEWVGGNGKIRRPWFSLSAWRYTHTPITQLIHPLFNHP